MQILDPLFPRYHVDVESDVTLQSTPLASLHVQALSHLQSIDLYYLQYQ